jgi:protein-tyrosine-phosphatase
MAAGLLHHRIAELGLADQVQVVSAGVYADGGHNASRFASLVLSERGITLAEHRSQSVTMDLLRQADLVLVMEESHRKSIFYLAPQLLSKVFLLSEMAGEHDDIDDPFGGTIYEYRETVGLLTHYIEQGLPRILKRLGIQAAQP